MDENNFMEKIGIVRDLGSMKVQLAELSGKLQALMDMKVQTHSEIKTVIDKHSDVIYGNGHEGLKTLVDRLTQDFDMRRKHIGVIYTVLIGLILEAIYSWLKHG